MAKTGHKKKSTAGVPLPLPKLGDAESSIMCSHTPPCASAEDCIKGAISAAMGITHRVTTVNSNGDTSESREVAPGPLPVGEAMRQAVEALGARTIDGGLTAGQLDRVRMATGDALPADDAVLA